MEPEAYPRFDARAVGRTLWRRAPLIIGLVIVAAVATYAFSSLLPKTYQAIAYVKVDTGSPALRGPNGGATDSQLMANEVFLAKSAAVRAAGAVAIGPDTTKVIAIDVSQVTNADVVLIAITSHDPQAAANAANAYASAYAKLRVAQFKSQFLAAADRAKSQADQYRDDIAQLGNKCNDAVCSAQRDTLSQQEGTQLALWNTMNDQAARSISIVTTVRSATPPSIPVSPTPVRDAGIAAAVALVFGIGLAFLLEQLDNRVKTPDDIARAAGGVALLGSLPAYSDGKRHLTHRFHRAERALVPPTSTAAESYFALATSLRFSSIGKEKRTILVTSSVGEEGKTTVTANLAAVLAESGFRVVVVSADLRRPMLGELLHSTETQKGLTSAMLGDRELAACFVSVPLPSGKNIFVLPSGPLPHEPAVLLGSDTFGTVLEQIKRSQADFILIDCAPVLPVSDPVAASRHVDGVLVLALHGETRKADLSETILRLRQVDAEIIGVVLNGVPQAHGRFDYYGYYGYRSEAASTNGSASTNGTKPGTPATNGKSAHADPAPAAPPPPGARAVSPAATTPDPVPAEPSGGVTSTGPNGGAPATRAPGDGYVEPRATILLKAAIVATYAGIVVLRPALPRNTAFVDPLIALMCFVGILKMVRHGSPATGAAARCLPWLWIILLGSLIGLAGVGLAFWGTSDLVVSYMAFLSFFAYWHIMYMTRTERFAIYGTAIGMVVVVFALVTGGGQYRQQAYFAQPNYPGHYMVMAAAIMLVWTKNRWLKALAVLAVLICVYETGSFGAVAFAGTLILVWAWRSITKHSAILVLALILLLLGAVFVASGAEQSMTSNGFNVSPSLNSTRFDRSSSSRYELWSQGWNAWVKHPLGVGPNGILSRKLATGYGVNLPIHNDLLSYLDERGPIGVIGLIGLWVAIWKRARPRGLARMLILGIVVASLFRQTMHYRHLWLFLALAMVMDARKEEEAAAREELAQPAAVV